MNSADGFPKAIWHTQPHRHRQDDLLVSCEVCNVTIQGDVLLSCASFANRQGNAQNGIGSKLSFKEQRGKYVTRWSD